MINAILFSSKKIIICLSLIMTTFLISCSPTIQVKAPDKPIEVNINLKIDHELKVKVDRQLDKIMKENTDIF